MEETLYKTEISTPSGVKTLEVMCADISDLTFYADVLVCSAFINDYVPVERTLIGALQRNQKISVNELAKQPGIDMRQVGAWLSRPVQNGKIGAVACVEMTDWYRSPVSEGHPDRVRENNREESESRLSSLDWHGSGRKDALLLSYSGLFTMLRFANLTGVPVETIVLPLLGAGKQMLDAESSAMALITESRNALETISGIKRIVIADILPQKAEVIAGMVRKLYPEVTQKAVFISYNHEDSYYAEYLAEQLIRRGIKVWIDSHKLKASEFGGMIVEAIESADLFAVLISRNSMESKHVLTEVANAFNAEPDAPEILPVRLDQTPYNKDFRYYLIGKHFERAEDEPRERELEKIAENILQFFEE